ncbi:hypothetical protein KFL_011230020 [Klebsormidium nitens]|uniref:Uncharacterized protein n=1 Tax=Klebsormidium nitens TaxID=105231 RepID=A0A1Y1IV76_KLENI|nr:hypothetical protein KFL_011230020 [Klebsormidium nitens]|eukprot:GAQ92756.1 hypothetical protein KFL_011230020 [Klebsormidium nitens]
MDFSSAPTIYIEHDGHTFPFFTCQSEEKFIFSLRVHFGAECPPTSKTVFLIGERDGPRGKELLKAPLSMYLENKISHTEPLKLEFVDDPQPPAAEAQAFMQAGQSAGATGATSTAARRLAGPYVDDARGGQSSLPSAQDKRAAKLRKGRIINKECDEDGVPLTTAGQNSEILLTSLERAEVRKFVLQHWELDEISGIPYDLTEQEESECVELSFLEMQKSPILRGRPYGALRHYARRWVWDMNRHRTKPLKRGLDILKLRKKGYESGGNGKATGVTREPRSRAVPEVDVAPKRSFSRKSNDKSSKPRSIAKGSAQGDKDGAPLKPRKESTKTQESGGKQKVGAAKDANEIDTKKSKGKRKAESLKEKDSGTSPGAAKDEEQDVDSPPARKRKKSAKVAENEARQAEKKEEAEKPAKVTKKAAEANRKRIARQLQEARVFETLADMKGTAPVEEDSADAWLETIAGRLPEVFTFDQILEKAPRRFSAKDVATALSDSGDYVLVQGCWVASKKYLRAEVDIKASPEEIATLGYLRGYFLSLLAKE